MSRVESASHSGRPFSIVSVEQGTEAWHLWRSQGVVATDAPTIMGENPRKSRAALLNEKIHDIRTPTKEAIPRGVELEAEARRRYTEITGSAIRPACLQSQEHEWLLASVDGITEDQSRVVEIKCGDSVYRQASVTRRVPRFYVGRLQHILAVTGLRDIDFWCYLPGWPEVHLRQSRDDDYIRTLLMEEEKFWEEVLEGRT